MMKGKQSELLLRRGYTEVDLNTLKSTVGRGIEEN